MKRPRCGLEALLSPSSLVTKLLLAPEPHRYPVHSSTLSLISSSKGALAHRLSLLSSQYAFFNLYCVRSPDSDGAIKHPWGTDNKQPGTFFLLKFPRTLLTSYFKFWDLYNRMPTRTSGIVRDQRQLQREVLKLRMEMNSTSSQDQFARWAKLRRQHDKAFAEYEKICMEF